MKNKILLVSLIITFIFIAILAAYAQSEIIKFGTHTVGTGGYLQVSLAAEGIMEKFPDVTVRAVPAGTDVARAKMVQQGEAHTAALNSLAAWELQEAFSNYNSPDWGPQPVRYLWIPQHAGIGMAVRGNSDIYQASDLKGRKVAIMPPSPSCSILNEAYLAYAGLTWDDVESVVYPGPSEAYDAVIKKRIDATWFNVSGSQAFELASMPCGIRYLEVLPTDEEAIKRMKEIVPMVTARLATVGAGLSEEDPKWVMTQGYPIFLAWAHLDEDIAYEITKLLHQSYPEYAKKSKSLKDDWTIDITLSLFKQDVAPFHEGSVRYFKEIGVWNEELEQINEERIQHQEQLSKLWEVTMKEAEEKNIKGEDFENLWMKNRADAGFYAR